MAVSDYVIEYKSRTLAGGAKEHSANEVGSKLQEYQSAGKLKVWTCAEAGDDQVRVWADQATLNEYNTWFASNGQSEHESTNTALGHVITKTQFTAS